MVLIVKPLMNVSRLFALLALAAGLSSCTAGQTLFGDLISSSEDSAQVIISADSSSTEFRLTSDSLTINGFCTEDISEIFIKDSSGTFVPISSASGIDPTGSDTDCSDKTFSISIPMAGSFFSLGSPFESHFVQVRGTNDNGETSTESSLQIDYLEAAPAAPTSLVIASISAVDANLTWASGGGTTVNYAIGYTTGIVPPSDCQNATHVIDGISSTSITVSGLSPSTNYAFVVCSRNGNPNPDETAGTAALGTTSAGSLGPLDHFKLTLPGTTVSPGDQILATLTARDSSGDVIVNNDASFSSVTFAFTTSSSLNSPNGTTPDLGSGTFTFTNGSATVPMKFYNSSMTVTSTELSGTSSESSPADIVSVDSSLTLSPPTAPSVALYSPSSSPSNVTSPILSVYSATIGNQVKLYSNLGCSTGASSAVIVSANPQQITATSLSSDTTYLLYAAHIDSYGNSTCSSSSLSYTLDTTAPSISSTLSLPSNTTYVFGEDLTFSLTFDEPIFITGGSPSVSLGLSSGTPSALYSSGSGTNTITFRYQIALGDTDTDGISITSVLNLNGASIKDQAGNSLGSTGFSHGSTSGIIIDTSAGVCAALNTSTSYSDMGTGTPGDPYILCTADQIAHIAGNCNSSANTACSYDFKLERTIDVTSLTGFIGIGSPTNPYTGTFDGNNHAIESLSIINPGQDSIGLFSVTNGATIKDLDLHDININAQTNVGALAGEVYSSTVDNVRLRNGTIVAKTYQGGLIGWAESSSLSNLQVISTNVTTSNASAERIGGVIGYLYNSSLQQVKVSRTTKVEATNTASTAIGGIVGYGNTSTVNIASSLARVTGGEVVGGIVGRGISTRLYKTNSLGDINGIGSGGTATAGLLAGSLSSYIVVEDSYARGQTLGLNLGFSGGLIGRVDPDTSTGAHISRVYVSGQVEASSGKCLFGWVNASSNANITFTDLYYNSDTCPSISHGGNAANGLDITGATTTGLQTAGTFTNFDFATVWNPPSGSLPFPELKDIPETSHYPAGTRLVFVTESLFDGNLGGLSGADVYCRQAAEQAHIARPGDFQAILSDGAAPAIARLSGASAMVNLAGETVSNTYSDFFNSNQIGRVGYSELGTAISSGSDVWTGSLADGSPSANTCMDWISNNAGDNGTVGSSSAAAASPLNINASDQQCSTTKRLYCITANPL